MTRSYRILSKSHDFLLIEINKNNNLQMKYYKKYKDYKKLTKYKRRKFKENLANLLIDEAMEKDPLKTWKLIDELKRESLPTDHVEKINHQKWFDHFNNLLNSETDNTDQTRQNYVKNELNDYESRHQSGKLDYVINEKEILTAVKKLNK